MNKDEASVSGENLGAAETNVTISSGQGSFWHHKIRFRVTFTDDSAEIKEVTWELKNLTDDAVIDSGALTTTSPNSSVEVSKEITLTANHMGDVIRLQATVSESKRVSKLQMDETISTYFT